VLGSCGETWPSKLYMGHEAANIQNNVAMWQPSRIRLFGLIPSGHEGCHIADSKCPPPREEGSAQHGEDIERILRRCGGAVCAFKSSATVVRVRDGMGPHLLYASREDICAIRGWCDADLAPRFGFSSWPGIRHGRAQPYDGRPGAGRCLARGTQGQQEHLRSG
jgi:hypothetical protein